MIEIKDLYFRYSKKSGNVLKGIDLTLDDGKVGVILGKNGSGKTTLFENILGISRPLSGSIMFNGQDIFKLSRRERARLISYVPQIINFGDLSVFDTVLSGRISHFGFKAAKEDIDIVNRIIKEIDLEHLSAKNVNELSGGEKQKVAIARALAQVPKMLIFDEPTGNLDIANEQLILSEAKRAASERGLTVLISMHDFNQALYSGDVFFLIKDGKIAFSGGKDIVNKENIKHIFDAEVRIIEHEGTKYILPLSK